ncbi:hypothetical protein RJ640_000779 [Escallonia rubra]|uniref:Uncharacterized protein n=1 Tax=Escallonia rubra TaxID=112253 RepID=A0AA88S3S4_9ASTE|nr:hypothetical protein RJ640_000779 [Escallonia rubra]
MGVDFATTMDNGSSLILGLTQAQHQELFALLDGYATTVTGNPSANMTSSNFSGKTLGIAYTGCSAFLHGDLEEEIYMKIPQQFAKQGEQRTANYGNPYMVSAKYPEIALIYVDDVIITGIDSAPISMLKRNLDAKFHIKDLGKL